MQFWIWVCWGSCKVLKHSFCWAISGKWCWVFIGFQHNAKSSSGWQFHIKPLQCSSRWSTYHRLQKLWPQLDGSCSCFVQRCSDTLCWSNICSICWANWTLEAQYRSFHFWLHRHAKFSCSHTYHYKIWCPNIGRVWHLSWMRWWGPLHCQSDWVPSFFSSLDWGRSPLWNRILSRGCPEE